MRKRELFNSQPIGGTAHLTNPCITTSAVLEAIYISPIRAPRLDILSVSLYVRTYTDRSGTPSVRLSAFSYPKTAGIEEFAAIILALHHLGWFRSVSALAVILEM
jgi:hypothetical protein